MGVWFDVGFCGVWLAMGFLWQCSGWVSVYCAGFVCRFSHWALWVVFVVGWFCRWFWVGLGLVGGSFWAP